MAGMVANKKLILEKKYSASRIGILFATLILLGISINKVSGNIKIMVINPVIAVSN